MLAGRLVNALFSPAGSSAKRTLPEEESHLRRPRGEAVQDSSDARRVQWRNRNRRQASERAGLPFLHAGLRNIWPIISHPGDGY